MKLIQKIFYGVAVIFMIAVVILLVRINSKLNDAYDFMGAGMVQVAIIQGDQDYMKKKIADIMPALEELNYTVKKTRSLVENIR